MLYYKHKINHERSIKQVAAAIVASSVVGGVMSSNAAQSAADTQANAQLQAASMQQQNYQQQLALQQPFISAGQAALTNLQAGTAPGGAYNQQFTQADMQNMPGYQFALGQGQQAFNQSAASKGMNLSGAAIQGLDATSQGIANQTYQQQYNNFMGAQQQQYANQQNIAAMGANATSSAQTGLASTGANQANLTAAAGATQASGQLASAGAINNSLNSIGQYSMFQSLSNPSSTTATQPTALDNIYSSQPVSTSTLFPLTSGGSASLIQ